LPTAFEHLEKNQKNHTRRKYKLKLHANKTKIIKKKKKKYLRIFLKINNINHIGTSIY
jgi:hypothetical protein